MEIGFPQIIAFLFVLIGFALLYSSFGTYKNFRLIKDIPRSTVRAMAMGIVELHGKVKPLELLISPFAKKDCVYFKYTIEELRQTGSGKNRSTKWVTIKRDERYLPFFALDETGEVLVTPAGAEFNIDLKHEYRQKRGLFGGLKSLLDTFTNLGDRSETHGLDIAQYNLEEIRADKFFKIYSTGDRRYREYYLAPDNILFVIGTAARETEGADRVVIRKGQNNPTFIIADKTEGGVLKKLRNDIIAKVIISVIFVVGGLFFILKLNGSL
ncbi:MAG: GIDE domain-containing protein [Candidatus Zixiibacteriota bacterium]